MLKTNNDKTGILLKCVEGMISLDCSEIIMIESFRHNCMNSITAQYGDNVMVSFSGDGLAALTIYRKNDVSSKTKE